MNIWVVGQEEAWTKQLADLCRKDHIYLYSGKYQKAVMQLLITDLPLDHAGEGMCKKIPFLVVSRENREEKILEAFKNGAEDYMIYPVSPKIAKARIQGILNRYTQGMSNPEKIYKDIHFTPNEYKILSHMMKYPGKVFTRSELIEVALPDAYEGFDRNIDNYMKQIRKKIKKSTGESSPIQTVYGLGYRYQI